MSRGAGQSAVRVAAYQARERLQDERTGHHYNYLPRERAGIAAASAYIERGKGYSEGRKPALFVGLCAPKEAPGWCRGAENVETFWNRLEVFERRRDAQIAERIIIALPHELTLQQNIWLLQDHVKEFTRQGRVVQVAIHEPEHSGPGAERNIHAHLLVSLRGVDEHGFKVSKTAEQQLRYLHRREYVQGLREKWADATNRHLARHGHDVRVDHRTLEAQGIDRAPTIHLGPGDSRRERHGERSAAGEVNREIAARNAEREARTRSRDTVEAGRERERTAPAPQRAQEPVQEAAQTREAARAPEAPAPAGPASAGRLSDSRRGRRARQRNPFGRAGKMFRSAFEAALDWIAPPVVADPHQQPVQTALPQPEQPAQPAPIPPKPPHLYERSARRRQEREQEEAQGTQNLQERFKDERDAAWKERAAAEGEVRAWFTARTQERRGIYESQLKAVKNSGLRGPARHDAIERLMAQQRIERAEMYGLRQQQLSEVRQAHPVPEWAEWLAREADKGDREAGRALARHQQREAERGYTEERIPLYQHFEAEREKARLAQDAVEQEVRARFAAYAQDLRGYYGLRFAQEKHSGMPGPVRHDALELVAAQRRGDVGKMIRLERQAIAEVRRAHPVPSWGEYLEREAAKGDQEAARALERHKAREAERNRDRNDDGRGIEPA